jgi:hypothetical protein
MFEEKVPLLSSTFMIMIIFLVQSIIPTIAIAEIGIRGSVAVYFFSYLNLNPVSVISTTISLWLINLVIPALIGTFFILQVGTHMQTEHETK